MGKERIHRLKMNSEQIRKQAANLSLIIRDQKSQLKEQEMKDFEKNMIAQ